MPVPPPPPPIITRYGVGGHLFGEKYAWTNGMNNMIAYGTGRPQYNYYVREMVDLSRKPDSYPVWKQKKIELRKAYEKSKE